MKYYVENLDLINNTTVKIHRVSEEGSIVSNDQFTNLDILEGSVGIQLKPSYFVNPAKANNHIGAIDIDVPAEGAQLITKGGVVREVGTNALLVTALKTLGLEVIELEDYVASPIEVIPGPA